MQLTPKSIGAAGVRQMRKESVMFLFAVLILTSGMDRQTAAMHCCQHGCRGQLGCAEQEISVQPMFSP